MGAKALVVGNLLGAWTSRSGLGRFSRREKNMEKRYITYHTFWLNLRHMFQDASLSFFSEKRRTGRIQYASRSAGFTSSIPAPIASLQLRFADEQPERLRPGMVLG